MSRLEHITTDRRSKPPIIGIFGTGGIGKTTLASEFPSPLFILAEDGLADIKAAAFPTRHTYSDIVDDLKTVLKGEHSYRTLVVDSLTQVEQLIWAKVCQQHNWRSIEEPGYGKGYVEADQEWQRLLRGLTALRDTLGMCIVLISHDDVRPVNDPTSKPYDRFQMRLHKRAEAMVRDHLDILGFLHIRPTVDTDAGRVISDSTRILALAPQPAYTAKCRIAGLPSELAVPLGGGFKALAKYIAPAAAKEAKNGAV